jgi:hypothetical protein
MPQLFNDTEIGTLEDVRKRAPVTIKVDGSTLAGRFHLITQQVNAGADVQVDKTFDEDILVTSFGQKLLPMNLVCIAIPDALCRNAIEGGNGVSEQTLAQLYRNRHAGRRKANGKITRITVAFDGEVFDGILIGINQVPHDLSDGANLDVFRYTLIIQGNFQ